MNTYSEKIESLLADLGTLAAQLNTLRRVGDALRVQNAMHQLAGLAIDGMLHDLPWPTAPREAAT